ncbi:MAG TPA: VOC family protein [Actinomycetota bacterium]|nr:VOC family protein [Actinomycetota bacterium]
MGTPIQVVIDCADPAALAAFWATALGYEIQPPPEGFDSWEDALASWGVPEDRWNDRSAVTDREGAGPRVLFQRVPEPKVVKNRVHVDVNAGGDLGTDADVRRRRVTADVARLEAAGASVLREMEEMGEHWVVMQDPEGNEFCVQ